MKLFSHIHSMVEEEDSFVCVLIGTPGPRLALHARAAEMWCR